jgi:O-antigen ligase
MMDASLTAAIFDRARIERTADALAVAIAVSIPWSTTSTSILVVLWLLTLLPTLQWSAVRREIWTPAGGLPVLFCLLAVIGMLWSDAPWHERLGGLDSFHRFLAVPLLLLGQFRRSGNGLHPRKLVPR